MRLRQEVALALAATIFAVTFAACGALQPASGTISGVAHGAKHWNSPDTGPPIAGRQITLLNADDGSIVKSVSTDAQGRFTFTVAPGDYSIWGGERADPIHVESGKTTTAEITVPEK
jgi:Carboxypeptidase regulatory-like domain